MLFLKQEILELMQDRLLIILSLKRNRCRCRGAAAMVGRHRSGAPVEFLPAERMASQSTTSAPQPSRAATVFNPATPLFSVGASPPPVIRQSSTRRMRSAN